MRPIEEVLESVDESHESANESWDSRSEDSNEENIPAPCEPYDSSDNNRVGGFVSVMELLVEV